MLLHYVCLDEILLIPLYSKQLMHNKLILCILHPLSSMKVGYNNYDTVILILHNVIATQIYRVRV